MGLSVYDEVSPILIASVILPADAGTYLTVVPAQPLPVRIDAIELLNYDTIAHVTGWRFTIGGSDYGIGQATAAIMAGFAGNPRADALTAIAATLVGAIILPAGVLLKWSAGATVLAGGSITALVYGGYL